MADIWRFGPVSEADFEPLLAIAHRCDARAPGARVPLQALAGAADLPRAFRVSPASRLILVGDETAGCVGFRIGESEIKINSFYLARRHHNRGLGTAILKVLLAEADARGLPVRLEVLRGSPAGRFYERHGFVKLGEDDIEAEYERGESASPAAA